MSAAAAANQETMSGPVLDAEAALGLPPGFRFHPTDEELVVHYLCRKAACQCLPAPIIADVDLYKHDPWDLPAKALFGKREWYFFTPRDRKYPNGSRPNRAAGRGYWKATGADKAVVPAGHFRALGIKKALVFYNGKAPRGVKTDWIMHEYRLADAAAAGKRNGSLRLDDWVLCRLYNKKNNWTAAAAAAPPGFEVGQCSGGAALAPAKQEVYGGGGNWLLDLNADELQRTFLGYGGGGDGVGLAVAQQMGQFFG